MIPRKYSSHCRDRDYKRAQPAVPDVERVMKSVPISVPPRRPLTKPHDASSHGHAAGSQLGAGPFFHGETASLSRREWSVLRKLRRLRQGRSNDARPRMSVSRLSVGPWRARAPPSRGGPAASRARRGASLRQPNVTCARRRRPCSRSSRARRRRSVRWVRVRGRLARLDAAALVTATSTRRAGLHRQQVLPRTSTVARAPAQHRAGRRGRDLHCWRRVPLLCAA